MNKIRLISELRNQKINGAVIPYKTMQIHFIGKYKSSSILMHRRSLVLEILSQQKNAKWRFPVNIVLYLVSRDLYHEVSRYSH